jgi:hypothetical protein
MNHSPIFVVGCARSGTTLLRDLLRSHPRLAFPPETHFIPRFYRAWGDPRSDLEARALGGRILKLRTIRRLDLDLQPSQFESCRSFAAVLEVLFGEYARREGRARWGEKTPQQVAEIPTLVRIFPRAKILHIHRDGRDVALSWLRRRFGPENLYAAAVAWRRRVSTGRRDGATLDGNYMEVRYEAVLDAPEAVMRAICEFIDEPFAEQVLRPAERPAVDLADKLARGRFRERRGIESENREMWRRLMPLSDRALFESVAGDLLAELGYEVEGLAGPIPRHRRAWWTAENAVRMALGRRRLRLLSPRDYLAMRIAPLRRRLPG